MFEKLRYLNFEDAIKKSLEFSNFSLNSELISINNSLNRVLSKDVICIKNLPSFNNSAMDGFAFKHSQAGEKLKIKRVIFAGDTNKDNFELLQEKECYKIMTGAKVPDDANTVVPIENCSEVTQDSVVVPKDIKLGSNLRYKAEELKEGEVLLKKGEKLTSSSIALLATQGIMMVEVYKKLSIAVLSTGNEIKEPWDSASDDEIYNCNSFAIISKLQESNFEATYCGVVPDNLEQSTKFISKLKNYDVIITSGGISMGDADFVAKAFEENGLDIWFHGVNVKPGRPLMMGKMSNSTVVCLPGNPLTAIVNIYLFVIPMLKKLQGENCIYHNFVQALNKSEFKTKKGRVNLVLGELKNGDFFVTDSNKYGSGMISALYKSNAILVSGESVSQINENDIVKVILLNNGLFSQNISDILN